MSIQSNPVIFVPIGQGLEVLAHLKPMVSSYAQSVAYINPAEGFNETWIKSEIGRIWKDFLLNSDNSADIIRVNYILGTDYSGLSLPTLRKYVEKYLAALYPAGILVDVYCLLNDNTLLENSDYRKTTLTMLQEQAGVNIYLLSNLISENIIITNKSLAHTIAMLTLFKDFVPNAYIMGADASRYNEHYFLDNCYSKQGQFLTAGSLNVTIPQDGLVALLMVEILSIGKNVPFENKPAPLDDSTFSVFDENICQVSMDYILGMALPEFKHKNQQTRRQWISQLFGERLNSLNSLETESSYPMPDLITAETGLYDLIRYTAKGGDYEALSINAINNCKTELKKAEDKFSKWLDTPPDLSKDSKESEKRRLSPLISQELWPFIIAHEYVHKQFQINELKRKLSVFEKRHSYVNETHQKLLKLLEEVEYAINEYTETSQVIDLAFEPFSPCASNYFRNIFAEYATNNHNDLAVLSAEITAAFLQDKFYEYLELLNEYINNNILPSDYFNKPIMDTMHDLISEDNNNDISIALGDWVFNHRRWNIRLKTGYASLHTEINIFMPAQGAAEVKRHYEERGYGRMNLFTDKVANSVSVLYHSGAFSMEDLYYESLYTEEI